MNNFRFYNWGIYTEAKLLFKDILKIYYKLPSEIKFSVGNQLIKSALSIILNIAEGAGKNSDKELNRFLDISVGSIYETFANLDILNNNGYIRQTTFINLTKKLENVRKQIGGFKKKLKS